MAEPISKKSGFYYRKTRARRIELDKAELSKIKPLTNFFKSSDNCDVPKKTFPERSIPSTSGTVPQADAHDNVTESENQTNANCELQRPDTQTGISKKTYFLKQFDKAFSSLFVDLRYCA